ncbi:hypothetical protein [Verrucomicrobium sp. BvORR034]|uniref:hypothetical protein n=1 Tax=Verrucomicrobium sp. BvORR034 TaxID=1396418 RepID=UPI0006799B4F|nr:hypothetical protein [Verrucomicrobium sp. BvORR034]
MPREQINRGRLRAQIAIQDLHDETVCLFCPIEVSGLLFQHFAAKGIPSTVPKGAMFGRFPQDELVVSLSVERASAEVTEFVASLSEICYERNPAPPARDSANLVSDHTGYKAEPLSWEVALATLTKWVPGFASMKTLKQLSFDAVASIMAAAPGGFQRIVQDVSSNLETFIIENVLPGILPRTREVIVIPDCGMVSLLPLRLTDDDFTRFVEEFERQEGGRPIGLLDGVSDILFVFDTGDLLLIDHDERIWFSSTANGAVSQPEV